MENDKIKEEIKLSDIDFNNTDKPLGGLNPNHSSFDIIGAMLRDIVIREVNLNSTTKLLDLGCGTGRLSKFIVPILGRNYHGFDINSKYIEYCDRTYSGNFICCDVQHEEFNHDGLVEPSLMTIPYEDNSFDVVVSFGVLNHLRLDSTIRCISESHRILKRGGVFVATLIMLNEFSINAINSGKTKRPFVFEHKSDKEWYDNQRSLLNVAIFESDIRRAAIDIGYMIIEPTRYGQWCGKRSDIGHDLIKMVKR